MSMRLRITLIALLFAVMVKAQGIFRLAEIEVHPQYLKEYLAAAAEIQKASLAEEPGVVCLFPTQTDEDSCQIRILEIYASPVAAGIRNGARSLWK